MDAAGAMPSQEAGRRQAFLRGITQAPLSPAMTAPLHAPSGLRAHATEATA